MEPTTLQDAILFFADPKNCREYLVPRRWPDGIVCPRCGSQNVLFLEKYNRWHCREKHKAPQFTLKTGTIFEDSALGLDKWLVAMWMIVNSKNGVSSWELHRSLGITQKSAWFVLHRIREAMQTDRQSKLGGTGPVEADETFVGGDPRKMHASRRLELTRRRNEFPNWKATEKYTAKIAVFGMLDRESRQVRAKVVPNVRRETLQNEILNHIQDGSQVYTDASTSYLGLKAQKYIHDTVNHVNEYVRGEVHTQGIENFWSLLKRGLRGTYIAVEPFHLDRYVSEQVFRYNHRATKDNPLNDADRFAVAVSQIVGRRLTYSELTGKDNGTAQHPL